MFRDSRRLSARGRLGAGYAVAALLLGAAAPALAQNEYQPKIRLHLVDPAGAAQPGVPLELAPAGPDWKPAPGGTVTRLKANKSGEATFAFLKPGEYVLHLALDAGKVPLKIATKVRDNRRKPLPGIDDREGALDPAAGYVPIQVPPDSDIVDVVLTIGPPPQKQATQAGPGDPNALDVKDAELKKQVFGAIEQIQNNQFAEGLATVDGLLAKRADMSPEDLASVLYMRGFALYKLDRGPEAEAPLKESIQLNPKFTSAYDLLSQIYIGQKKFAEASEVLRADLEQTQDPNRRAPMLLNYALALREQKRDADAVAPLEEAHSLSPGDATILVQLADTYMAAGRNEDADKLLATAADLPPNEGAALHFNMAATLARAKNYVGAEQHFRKALELNPQLVEARRYIGETLLSQGKRAEGLAELEAYLAAAPNAPDAADVKSIVDALKKESTKKKK